MDSEPAFAGDADNKGHDVEQLSTAGASKATSLFAGLVAKEMAAGKYGLVQCFGPCTAARHYLAQTKATNSSTVPSTAWDAGNIMALDTVGNGLVISGTVGQSAYLPALVLLGSNSVPSSTLASGTANATVTRNVEQSVFVRAM